MGTMQREMEKMGMINEMVEDNLEQLDDDDDVEYDQEVDDIINGVEKELY